MLTDTLTGALNQSTEFPIEPTTHIEKQTINWINGYPGLPDASRAAYTSEESPQASLIGLTVARHEIGIRHT